MQTSVFFSWLNVADMYCILQDGFYLLTAVFRKSDNI